MIARAISLGSFAALAACTPESPAPPQAPAPITHVYTVRGRVVTVPSPDRPLNEFNVHHEAIPSFAGADGNVFVSASGTRGMKEMVMPFPLAPNADLTDIAPGDKIEFTFEVVWKDNLPDYEITNIRELPPETPLNISGERPEAPANSGQGG